MPQLAAAGVHIHDFDELDEDPAHGRRRLLQPQRLPRAHAAGLRPRPAVPAHLQPEPQPGRPAARRERPAALRPRQGALDAAASRARAAAQGPAGGGQDAPLRLRLARAAHRRQPRRALPGHDDRRASTPSGSRATPRWPSRSSRPTTCSRPSKRACCAAGSARSCASRSTAHARRRAPHPARQPRPRARGHGRRRPAARHERHQPARPRPARPQGPAVRAGRARAASTIPTSACSPRSASTTSSSTVPTTRSSRSSTGSRRAAHDPDVLAIKMTLYRVGRNAPVVAALLEAARNGKEVAVLVELKARFDEESNIEWARALEDEGVHVVYGLVGLKTHSKIALVVRREGDGIRRYVHLGTGNYNVVTARLYTDLDLFTCDEVIGQDATELFNFLTGFSRSRRLQEAPGRADQPARALRGPDRTRDRAPARRPRRPPHLQDELARRPQDDRHPLPGLAGRREDRPAGARHVLAAARHSRRERQHQGDEHRRPLPRAQPHLLVPQRRRRAGARGQRRPHAAQPQPPRRGPLPRRGPGHRPPPARRDPRRSTCATTSRRASCRPTAPTCTPTRPRARSRSKARPGSSSTPPTARPARGSPAGSGASAGRPPAARGAAAWR